MELPKRKHPRLKEYDYSQNGCYFVTICVKDRLPLLGSITVGRDALIPPHTTLSDIGRYADQYIQSINTAYAGVSVDCYIIMPDHIHLLLTFTGPAENGGMRASRPTLQTVVRSFKTMVTKAIGQPIWQTSFYDTVIRNEKMYLAAWRYIAGNPSKKEP